MAANVDNKFELENFSTLASTIPNNWFAQVESLSNKKGATKKMCKYALMMIVPNNSCYKHALINCFGQ